MSSGFYGIRSVASDLNKHRGTSKVAPATLKPWSTGDNYSLNNVTYASAYVWPRDKYTALGVGGNPNVHTRITLWRQGESQEPKLNGKIESPVGSGVTYLIVQVEVRLNADEDLNHAVYDCDVTRAA